MTFLLLLGIEGEQGSTPLYLRLLLEPLLLQYRLLLLLLLLKVVVVEEGQALSEAGWICAEAAVSVAGLVYGWVLIVQARNEGERIGRCLRMLWVRLLKVAIGGHGCGQCMQDGGRLR